MYIIIYIYIYISIYHPRDLADAMYELIFLKLAC